MNDREYFAWLIFGGVLTCASWFTVGYLLGQAR